MKLWQDPAGTTPAVEDGDPIGCLETTPPFFNRQLTHLEMFEVATHLAKKYSFSLADLTHEPPYSDEEQAIINKYFG